MLHLTSPPLGEPQRKPTPVKAAYGKEEAYIKRKNRNKGFSLIELIIVIAILAVLVAVVAPQYFQYVEKSRRQVCVNNVSEATRAALMDYYIGDHDTYNASVEAMYTAYFEGAGAAKCPSGGTYSVETDAAAGEEYINCSKHGRIASFGDEETLKAILAIMEKEATKMDSEAYKFGNASTKKVIAELKKELDVDLDAMGAKSWAYLKDSNGSYLYWSQESIADKNVGDEVCVMRYNGSTGTYTVWKTKVASITTKFDGDKEASEPYKVFGNYSQYNPDKLESKDQTYESALKLYKEAVAAQQKKS